MRLLFAVAVVLAFTLPPAIATDFPAIGGSGDHQAVDRCPDGMYLIGLKGRTGPWVNQVQIVCAPIAPLIYGTGWLPANGAGDAKWFGPERGGTGGVPKESDCPADAYVIAAGITLTPDKTWRFSPARVSTRRCRRKWSFRDREQPEGQSTLIRTIVRRVRSGEASRFTTGRTSTRWASSAAT